jgi:DNA-binding transcriptional MerR regulator
MKFYSIQTVSQLCGLSSHCIRAWEKRYGAITPQRSDNGRRLYTENELNRLLMLGKLSSMGNSISLIANLPDDELERLLEKMSHGRGIASHSAPSKSLVEPKTYLMNIFMALSAYKLDILTHELNKASMDLSCKDFALEVVAALFRKVGEYVHDGRMSIAQEQTLSAITKFFIGRRIGQHYRKENKSKFKITLATPVGEHHSIGLLLASLLMAEHGIDFIYLGEDMSEESIAEAAKATDSDVILLAISPAYGSRTRGINEVSLNLRKHLPQNIQIWVGGSVDQLKATTLRETQLTTFNCLAALDAKLSQLS